MTSSASWGRIGVEERVIPRQARVVAVGCPHHITQRGNNRQDVFLLDDDRRWYLETLREQCRRESVRLLGYCLMMNHVHLVAIPERPESLARGLGGTNFRHTQRFNRRYRRSGHLWQDRFYSCPLGPSHLINALAYVDLNPVRADGRASIGSRARLRTWQGATIPDCWTCGRSPRRTREGSGRSCWLPRKPTRRPRGKCDRRPIPGIRWGTRSL